MQNFLFIPTNFVDYNMTSVTVLINVMELVILITEHVDVKNVEKSVRQINNLT